MFHQLSLLSVLIAAAACPAPAAAHLPDDFRTLAQQRPWLCADQHSAGVPRTGWSGGGRECAWQNRLRMQRWSGQGGAGAGMCVSAQAQWWAWARAAGAPLAWRTLWTARSIIDESGPEKRIVIVQRLADDAWSVTEWRWNPSPRAATRRWQEGRWKLLAAHAARLNTPLATPNGAVETRMLQRVLEANLGNRVGEVGSQSWQWQADGLCLTVDAAGLGKQIMQLPYSADDSRLEQRAAMQLQLARRYPKATWLSDFAMVPAAPHARGGAKFYALWLEGSLVKGQLWIPTKGDGPSVRLRIVTGVPTAAGGQAAPPAVARAEQVLRRELMGIAARWTAEHE